MKLRVLVLSFFLTAVGIRGASITWTNTAGGSWQTAANWSPNVVPGINDTATITAAGTYTITLANNVSVSTVFLGGGAGFPTIQVSANVLEATNSATISAQGTLTVLGGGLKGKINVVGGVLKFEGAGQKSLYSTTLFTSASGTIQWKAGPITLGATPTTFITNNGTWEINSDESIYQGIGGPFPEIVNAGTITKSVGTGTTTFSNLRFKNTGTLTAQTGTIQFNSQDASEIGGTFTAQSGATIQLAGGTYTEKGGVFTGAGTLRMTSGTLTLVNDKLNGLSLNGGNIVLAPTFQSAGAITDLTLNGATLTGTNEVAGTLLVNDGGVINKLTVRNGGTLTLAGSAQKNFYGATLINNGTVRWNGGPLTLGSTPTTIITNNALWEINSDQSLYQGIGGPTPVFVNSASGTIRKIGGSGTTSFSNFQLVNAGTIEVQNGTLQTTSIDGAVLGGSFMAAPGATLSLNGGTYTENGGVFSGGGSLRFNSGTLTMVTNPMSGLLLAGGFLKLAPTFQATGAITNLTVNGSTLTGTNEVAGTLTMASGSLTDSLKVRPAGTLAFSSTSQKTLYSLQLVNNGTVKWQGGNLAIGSTPTTLITNIGLWEINSDDSIYQGIGGPDPVFANQGTIRKLGGSGTTTFSNLQFINSGLVEAQSGTINFNSMDNAILGGTFTAQPGATIQFQGGAYTENGATFGGGGTLKMTGGTLTLVNNPLAGFTLAGGTVKLTSTFQNNGAITNLTLNGSTLSGTNEVAGTLTVLSGSLTDLLTVRATGTLALSSSAQKTLYSLRLVNNGTVRWLGGSLAMGSTPATLITNIGLWEINSDESIYLGIGGPTPIFMNKGTVRKIGGSGTTTFSNFQFINESLVEAQNGTLNFNNMAGSLIGGTWTAQPGTTIQLGGGTYTENGGVFNGGGTLRMTFGTLTLVTNKLNGLVLSGGDVKVLPTFQAAGAITDLTLNGANLIGTNEVAGTVTFAAGGFDNQLTVRPGGTLVFSSANQKTLYSARLINNGTVRWQAGNLTVGATPATMINNGGLWEINSDDTLYLGIGGPTPVFSNSGTIRKLGGSGATTFANVQFINSGLVEAQNGTIQFNGQVNSLIGGNFTAASGAAIVLSGGTFIENGGVFGGAGASRLTSGTLNLISNILTGLSLNGGTVRVTNTFQAAGAITNLTVNGATLAGTNEIEGTVTMNSGDIVGQLTIRPSGKLIFATTTTKTLYTATVINNGTVLWQGGNLAMGATPTTLITNNGLWDTSDDSSMYQGIGGPDPVFANGVTGTFRKSGGTQATTFSSMAVNNNGVMEAVTGTVRFPNNYTHNSGKLRLNGGKIEAVGTLTFASGTLEGSGSFGANSFTGGTISPGISGPGKINFTSGLNLTSGATVVIDAVNTTPGTGHDQLAVTGAVNLGNANLNVSSIASVVVGSRFQIIDNDGVDGVIGLFNAFPEGWLFSHNFQLFRIRYSVGTGNDVAIIRDDGGVRLTAIAFQPDGSFLINGLGTNFGIYTISATTDFKTWTELGTTTANSGGNFQFFDTNRLTLPYRFYRSLGPGVSFP